MKIGSNPGNAEKVVKETTTPIKAGPAEAAKTGAPASVATGATPEASTKVALSSAATGLTATDSSSAEFDSAKVASISKAIEDGTYKVNHSAIADKLIANAQEALGKVSH